ncbi:MAG: hypothetical protein SF182_10865, partial [Deltaproteobacteria bacterium]|nr:hypothetical protein [Deltaproteobacteria bacterium]
MAGYDWGRGWAAAALAMVLALGGMLVTTAQPAMAACCACYGGGCGTGFCADEVTGVDCTLLCISGGCQNALISTNDDCNNGCGAIVPQPTATFTIGPSRTPTDTPTPTPTIPTPTASSTVTQTATITSTGTVTATATNTPIPPTPIQCCECPSSASCGAPSTPGTCLAGCNLKIDASCDSRVGGSNLCLTNTITPTVTLTPTITKTLTQTPTITSTPTVTHTPTRTNTPVIPTDIDPYKCYRVKAQDRVPSRTVQIVDQFENKRMVVLKPFLLCNPSMIFPPPTPPPAPSPGASPTMGPSPTATALTLKFAADHLVCYKIKDDKKGGTQPTFKGKTVVIR